MPTTCLCRISLSLIFLLACSLGADAADYLLTIGGGYEPEANQASLEANVQFYQRVVHEQYALAALTPPSHAIFFADGTDPIADLQVASASERPSPPLVELLESLHRAGRRPALSYRTHEVPDVEAGNDPAAIRAALRRIASQAQGDDRLILYVTAHGSRGTQDNPYDTTISCWNGQTIRMHELAEWLEELPPRMSIVLVMAQCYCGGFGDLVFARGDRAEGLTDRSVVGFFAQQHNLAAAGCRPDIANDAEYSSYFWGAFVGRTRNGLPMEGCDANGDGTVSFAEAHAQAVIVADTIDIPLTASEVLLRTYSRIDDYTLRSQRRRRGNPQRSEPREPTDTQSADEDQLAADDSDASSPAASDTPPAVQPFAGDIAQWLDGRPAHLQRVVRELCQQLEIPLSTQLESLAERWQSMRRPTGSPRGGRRRRDSARRALLEELAAAHPELAEPRSWREAPLLATGSHDELLKELQSMPSYGPFIQQREERAQRERDAEARELRAVKMARLIDTLEHLVLEANLPHVADEPTTAVYRRMQQLESSGLAARNR